MKTGAETKMTNEIERLRKTNTDLLDILNSIVIYEEIWGREEVPSVFHNINKISFGKILKVTKKAY